MFSPQDIEEKTFEKAFMGGYKADDVDDFLENLQQDYKKLFMENSDLKKKIAILAEKIEEYRKDEEYIKSAILYSQKLKEDSSKTAQDNAEQIINDAALKAQQIIEEANDKAKEIHEEAERFKEVTKKTNQDLIDREKEALNAIKKEVFDFKQNLQNMYKQHLKIIMSLPNYEEPQKPDEDIKPQEVSHVPEKEEEEPTLNNDIFKNDDSEQMTAFKNSAKINIALDVQEEPDEDEEYLPPPKFNTIDFKVTPKK